MNNRMVVLLLGILSVIASVTMLLLVLTNRWAQSDAARNIFLVAAVVNAVGMLVCLRLIFSDDRLSNEKKNAWSIAVFFGLGFGQLAYVLRYRWKPLGSSRAG